VAAEPERVWLKSPERLLARLGIEEPEEIDVEAIAQACGATVIYRPLVGCAARLLGVDARAIISVDEKSSRPRQRFSVAHELGHWLHDRGRVARVCREGPDGVVDGAPGTHESDVTTQPVAMSQAALERRANRFAAELLLPRSMCKRLARRLPITVESAQDLATRFSTSLTATLIRLVELAPVPALLACFHDDGRQLWRVQSQHVPQGIRPHERMPSRPRPHSTAKPPPPGAPRAYPAEAWLDHPDALFYTVDAQVRAVGASSRLVLLTWREEDLLRDVARAQERAEL
jgi:Zn-dependent peptidase ImmA (M78 family)